MDSDVNAHFCPIGDRRRPVAILFDLDGTLVDHEGAATAAAKDLFRSHREWTNFGPEVFLAAWGDSARIHWRDFERGHCDWITQGRRRIRDVFQRSLMDDQLADELFAQFVRAYEAHWAVFPDVLRCLDRLRGRPMAVVTNGAAAQQRRKLRKLGLREHFKEVVISEEVGIAKPEPGIFLEASRRLWSLPGECIVVGDSWTHDIEGARRSGMQAVHLVRTGRRLGSGIPTLDGLEGLPDLVDRWQIAKPEEKPELDFAA